MNNIKEYFLAFIDCFEDLGKEVYVFIVLSTSIGLLLKGFINGQQFTDLIKTTGVAYIGGCAVGNTSDVLIKHLETKAIELKDRVIKPDNKL